MSQATYRGVAYDTKHFSAQCEQKVVTETYRGIKYNKKVEVCK